MVAFDTSFIRPLFRRLAAACFSVVTLRGYHVSNRGRVIA
jgi:hypothetical protein